MLTINVDDHPLMRQFHKSHDEKRMVIILPHQRYQDWLNALLEHVWQFLLPFLAESLQAQVLGQGGST